MYFRGKSRSCAGTRVFHRRSLQVGSQQTVSRWENDSGYPETEKPMRIAAMFQVRLDIY